MNKRVNRGKQHSNRGLNMDIKNDHILENTLLGRKKR